MNFNRFLLVFLTLQCQSSVKCQSSTRFNVKREQENMPYYRIFRMKIFNFSGYTANSPEEFAKSRRNHKFQAILPLSYPFPCDKTKLRSRTKPTSVHKVRPGDIDVIAAMGDSLSSGNGASSRNSLETLTENRGLSATGGGQSNWREFLTLPNIIKEINPNLVGYALGDGLSIMKNSQFNVAEPFGLSQDMPYMAKELVRRVKNDSRVDFENDWKLVSLMIGANNICSEVCWVKKPIQYIESHKKHIIEAFRYLRDNMPRTIVNLLIAPDFKILETFTDQGIWPVLKHMSCSCMFGDRFVDKHEFFTKLSKRFQDIDIEISQMPEFLDSDTFQLIEIPFAVEVKFPLTKDNKTDLDYLGGDGFHFSQLGHALTANAVWNNMLEPFGNKSKNWHPPILSKFICPTDEHPYISTSKNSN